MSDQKHNDLRPPKDTPIETDPPPVSSSAALPDLAIIKFDINSHYSYCLIHINVLLNVYFKQMLSLFTFFSVEGIACNRTVCSLVIIYVLIIVCQSSLCICIC